MATLSKRTGKTPGYEIRFFDSYHRRLTIYLGGRIYSERTACEAKEIVERLVYYRANSRPIPDKRTLAWVESAAPEIRKKLALAGLIEIPKNHTVQELWDSFLEQKTGVKQSTIMQYKKARTYFLEFFRGVEPLVLLTKERFLRWKSKLLKQFLPATAATYIKQAKAVFNWAVEEGWLDKSPLDGVGRGSFINRSKDRIISMDEYYRLLEACPSQEWRTIIALSRIGGLRCPSEVLALRWEDVNWEQNGLYVRSPKTAHHEGKESRIVPIFPELKEELETLFFRPESEGKEFVVNRYRRDSSRPSLSIPFAKIAKQAGLPTISRPFDNMRMTRSNEIYNRWGAFKESQWIGHSSRVRADHYLMIQEADYEEAAQWKSQRQSRGYPQAKSSDPPENKPKEHSVCLVSLSFWDAE